MAHESRLHSLTAHREDWLRVLGAVAGGSLSYWVTTQLTAQVSVFACAIIIALTSLGSVRRSQPMVWWGLLGAIAGSIVGTGSILADTLQPMELPDEVKARAIAVASLALAGCVAGAILGWSLHKPHIRHPREFLKAASALTTGIFAVFVTLKFIQAGLDPARTLSSKLSISLTILVASLTVPGWLGYLLGRSYFKPHP